MRPSSSTIATLHVARMRTRSEVADKINAAYVLLNGIDFTGNDEKIVEKVQALLADAIEIEENKGWFCLTGPVVLPAGFEPAFTP